MRELIEDTLKRAQRKGAQFADLRIAAGSQTAVEVEDGRADTISHASVNGAGLRVLVEGAWGFAPTNKISTEELNQCVDDAVAMARAAASNVTEPGMVAEVEPVEAKVSTNYQIDPAQVPLSERVSAVFEFEKVARERDAKRIVNTAATYADSSAQMQLGNTFGTYLEYESVRCRIGVVVTAQEDNVRQQAADYQANAIGYELVSNMDPHEFAGKIAGRALKLLSAAPPPAGKFEVIIDPRICGLLVHEAFGHNCEADAVWSGNSILEGKIGEMVAAPMVTIIDDPTLPDTNGSYQYDHEGVPARRHVLVEDGVLQGFLHDLETAARFGVAPNGSGRAGGCKFPPLPRMSNTFIVPGQNSLEEMIADIDHGLYLKGGRWGYVFTAQGQFTCNVEEAYAIEKGELGQHYRNVNISGMTLETLQTVTAVGSDLTLRNGGTCGKDGQGVPVDTGGPHLRIAAMVVGGQQ